MSDSLGVGSKVLMPGLYPGTIVEIDQSDGVCGGMVRVRHVAWNGGPSVLSTWFEDISVLRPLPVGFVQPEPTPEERAEAALLAGAIEEALGGLLDE